MNFNAEEKDNSPASEEKEPVVASPEPSPSAEPEKAQEVAVPEGKADVEPEAVEAEAPAEKKDAKKAKRVKKEKAEEAEEIKKEEKEEVKDDRKWYVIQTLTGQEDRVKESIERSIKGTELEGKVYSVLVPEEDTIEIRKGKRVEKKKKMFPGYVFIEMLLDDQSWYGIRQTPGVARFIGNKTSPIPVVDREMQRVLKQLGVREEKIEMAFDKGETIRIIGGPFRGYTGTVEEVNSQKEKIKALVNIFGRDTPVEIDFDQAEKVV